jgi:hypothetical protein
MSIDVDIINNSAHILDKVEIRKYSDLIDYANTYINELTIRFNRSLRQWPNNLNVSSVIFYDIETGDKYYTPPTDSVYFKRCSTKNGGPMSLIVNKVRRLTIEDFCSFCEVDSIIDTSDLEFLRLTGLEIESLSIFKSDKLTHMELVDTIIDLNSINMFPNLIHLEIHDHYYIPEFIICMILPYLTDLTMTKCDLTEITFITLENLPSLQNLDLEDNNLTITEGCNDHIAHFTLNSLNLLTNNYVDPELITKVKKFKYSNKNNDYPKLLNLRELDLSNKNVWESWNPPKSTHVPKLRKLIMCNIKNLSNDLKWTLVYNHLVVLDISNNGLRNISWLSMVHFPILETLNISNNSPSEVILYLPRLKTLDLSNTNLTNSWSINYLHTPKLHSLYLDNNHFGTDWNSLELIESSIDQNKKEFKIQTNLLQLKILYARNTGLNHINIINEIFQIVF